ncbi:hypothetical protein ACFRKB_02740 [Streptomyces scopuliridis]|uniref:hypothetical protein n=1 Tax=Streptomyces scopuliridis TaxID=452529 RepID=UPI0036855C07
MSKLNHYSSDDDTSRWTVEDTATGAPTRSVNGFDGSPRTTGSGTRTSRTYVSSYRIVYTRG